VAWFNPCRQAEQRIRQANESSDSYRSQYSTTYKRLKDAEAEQRDLSEQLAASKVRSTRRYPRGTLEMHAHRAWLG